MYFSKSWMSLVSFLFLGGALLLLTSCQTEREISSPQKDTLVLARASFSDLDGWKEDNIVEALPAMRESCRVFLKKAPESSLGGGEKAKNWVPFCKTLQSKEAWDQSSLRALFEKTFDVYSVTNNGNPEGLFTGYYEPELKGNPQKTAAYPYPLYKRPDNLITIDDLGIFSEELKGKKLAGRVVAKKLVPYYDRQAIAGGALDRLGAELVWVASPVEAFFLQVQGSGIVRFEDGTFIRVGYDAQNGHPYRAIGKLLLEMGELEKGNVSMQSLKAWLQKNPDKVSSVLNFNPSYVFFRILNGKGPLGCMGVPLTPERSLAVDRSLFPMGVPVWLDAAPPLDGAAPLQKVVVIQDTGGAIRGPVRGDFFWGAGEEAAKNAGHMQSRGRFFLFLPKK